MSMLMLMLFIFDGFSVHHEDGLTYSDRTDRPAELFYFFIWNSLSRKLTYLRGFLTMILVVPLFWIYFYHLTLVLCNAFFSIWKLWSCCCLSFYRLDFKLNLSGAFSLRNFCTDWDGSRDHLRDVSLEDAYKLSTSTAASKFCRWIQELARNLTLATFDESLMMFST